MNHTAELVFVSTGSLMLVLQASWELQIASVWPVSLEPQQYHPLDLQVLLNYQSLICWISGMFYDFFSIDKYINQRINRNLPRHSYERIISTK